MPEKAVRNSFFEKICRIGSRKKAYADALAFFIVFAASVLTTFAVGRLVPSSEEARLSVTVEDAAGDAILEEKDIEDISIFYATEDDPEFSDRLKISKDDILSYCPAILNWKYATHLPNSIVGIRVDIALAETAGLKDGVFPEVKLKINKTKFYGSARRKKHLILRKTEGNHYQFEIGKKGVAGSRTSYRWRVLFSLFFIIMTAFLALRSFCAGVFSHRDKARREGKSLSAGSVQTICLKCLMIVSFFLLSLFPVFKFNPDKIDTWENRTLEPFPEHFHFNDASACFAQIEKFFNDRFFGRNFLIGLADKIRTTFERSDTVWVFKGDDDWLFYYQSLPETKHSTFKHEYFPGAEEYIGKIADYAASRGKRFIYVICPDKYRIYGDKLKSYASNYYLRDDVIDDFVERLRSKYDFPVIYQRHELLQKKAELGHDLYFRYDTHWTEEGAYYGLYLPLLKELSVAPVPIDRWEQKESRSGDLFSFLFKEKGKDQPLPPHRYYEPAFGKTASVRTVKDIHIPNEDYDIVLSDNPDGAPHNVVFLRDSFMNAAIDIFANTFRQSVFIRRYRFFKSDMDYIDRSDVIVLEQVERYVYQALLQEFDLEN